MRSSDPQRSVLNHWRLAVAAARGRHGADGDRAGTPASMDARLRQLFPTAAAFSSEEDAPPHFKAFVTSPSDGAPTWSVTPF